MMEGIVSAVVVAAIFWLLVGRRDPRGGPRGGYQA